jgi:hypothetical protein
MRGFKKAHDGFARVEETVHTIPWVHSKRAVREEHQRGCSSLRELQQSSVAALLQLCCSSVAALLLLKGGAPT